MSKIILVALLFYTQFSLAQKLSGPIESSRSEKLSLDAYSVFKTNKFLNFKNHNLLTEIIDKVVFKKTDLDRYFTKKKDWSMIEKEDTSNYRKPFEKYSVHQYHYKYNKDSMIENFRRPSVQPGMYVELKTIFNAKGFINYEEKQTYLDQKVISKTSSSNTFDKQNRVIRVIQQTTASNNKTIEKSIIDVRYDRNTVTVSSANGQIKCVLQ